MKILIIKVGAIGDVLRTTTLLHGLKREWPASEITWVTSDSALDLLKENNFIDTALEFNRKNTKVLGKTSFDLLICLDKEKEIIALANRVSAEKKVGFGCDKKGNLTIFNKESEYAYRLGLSDELKFKINKKTYPEVIYEMCGLRYKGDKYILDLRDVELKKVASKLRRLGIQQGDFIVGLNTGAGTRFANKIWPIGRHKVLIKELLKYKDLKVLLLGGREEEKLNQRLASIFRDRVYNTGSRNTLRGFASIIKHCDAVISGDTLAMHLGIALNRYTIAIFGPTCSQEIELYDNGKKIASDIECSPCYKRHCSKTENCMSRVQISDIIRSIEPCLKP